MRTREEHMKFCKDRAMEYFNEGDLNNAVTSMASDLGKHPETKGVGESMIMLGMMYLMQHDRDGVRRWIEGFN